MKQCSKCEKILPRTSFYKSKKVKDKIRGYCKKCDSARHKIAYKQKSANHRERWLRVNYNLTLEGYENLFKEQLGTCAICKRNDLSGRRLAVDHDHSNGQIRGLLCLKCNRGLGCFDDTEEFLVSASNYLIKSKEKINAI